MKFKSCYLCVDKDGTEKITNSIPIRRKFKRTELFGMFCNFCIPKYSKNNWNKWCDGWSSKENNNLPFFGVILPKGTIEKIIGKKLTWNDEPVDISNI